MTAYSQEELERLLIGSLLVKGTNCVVASKYITARDFMFPASRDCFTVACELQAKSNPVNVQSVCLEAGVEYASYLAGALDVGIASNCERISKEIADSASKRRLAIALSGIQDGIESNLVDTTLHNIHEAYKSETRGGEDDGEIKVLVHEFSNIGAEGGGFNTGFDNFDCVDVTYDEGFLVAIGGYTSTGKSAFAIEQINRVEDKCAVVLFSTEMTRPQIISRLLAQLTGFSSKMILKGRIHDERLDKAKKYLSERKLIIYDKLREFSDIANEVRSLNMQGKCNLYIVDYIQNVRHGLLSGFPLSDTVAKEFQALNLDERVTGVMLSQISNQQFRDDSGGVEFKGGGTLGECCDIGLWLSKSKQEENAILCEMRKNRHGMRRDFLLHFNKNYSQLLE